MIKVLMAGAVALLVGGVSVLAQADETPDILHAADGQITWTNVNPSLYYTVQWRRSLTGGEWRSVYKDFRDLQSDEGTLTQSIPLFFRIVAHEAPEYLRYMTATSHWMEAGYYPSTNLALVDPNLKAENIRGGTTVFGINGTVLTAMGDATPEDVLDGRTFSNTEAAGATGTMPNIGAQTITPGTEAQTITHGYHDGEGEVAGDAALVTGNIKAGVEIFGIAGDSNVVNTSSGDATPTDILAGRTGWVSGSEITGTRPTAPVPVSGQTNSLHFGDDGVHQKGVAVEETRFVVTTNSGDEVVTDLQTGLMWTRNANLDGQKTWTNAVNYCSSLEYSDYSDWRLPNVKELQSLIDFGEHSPALPEGHPFTNVQPVYYWSGTSNADFGTLAWNVYLSYGHVYSDFKTTTQGVWPVRGGL